MQHLSIVNKFFSEQFYFFNFIAIQLFGKSNIYI